MTTRRRGLQLDDPLAATQPAARDRTSADPGLHSPPKANGRVQASSNASPLSRLANAPAKPQPASRGEPEPPAQTEARHGATGVWRVWSGVTGVGSFRLPHELLIELSDTAREHGLPIGMIVTAAITQLLDQPPDQIAELVDRADDARIHGRRRSRRSLTATER
jgi:hypothetical protein